MTATWPAAQRLIPARARPGRVQGSTPRPDDHVVVMFGATGDLARRKLLPGLFHLAAAGLMPGRYRIIGSSRRSLTGEQVGGPSRHAIAEVGASKPTGAARHALQHQRSLA